MHFDEVNEGDYKIYAGALEAPAGAGYIAAVVVNRLRGVPAGPCEAYRDVSMSCGHRWETPEEALNHAVAVASQLIHREPHRLAC